MNRKLHLLGVFTLVVSLLFSSCKDTISYETVPNDPLNAKIYTLKNGLKVYMTVNKEAPRIQTYIAVRVGGKNDPAETTGLAHYFEHIMFKGTKQFGTLNYEAEKPLLDEIERLFEVYRQTTNEEERAKIYHQIDSVSYEASKYGIPNEYDKLMAVIGSSGTNAWTSYDETVYTEDIPSNEIENWARIQADRFKNPIIRGFHTELETVYEEKNMSLTSDSRKIFETILSELYPNHPYGKQTVIGTHHDLKNPSITNIKKYFDTYYVANNIAICLSGDFNPDEMIHIIEKYFSDMRTNKDIPKLQYSDAPQIAQPIEKEVIGNEAERVSIAWRVPGVNAGMNTIKNLTSYLLSNGTAGILDEELVSKQKVLEAFAYTYDLTDCDILEVEGTPKEGQSLDEVKDLLLGSIQRLKKEDLDPELIKAAINNIKRNMMQRLEYNGARANLFVSSFIRGQSWEESVRELNRIDSISAEDIIDFAKTYLADNYIVVKKRKGKDPNEVSMTKPQITPIVMNRDSTSRFLIDIQTNKPQPLNPVFVNPKNDIQRFDMGSRKVYLSHNSINDLFTLKYELPFGFEHFKDMKNMLGYLAYIGTDDMSLEEFNKKLFALAATYRTQVSQEKTYIYISGLNSKLKETIELIEKKFRSAKIDEEVYKKYAKDILKERSDDKLNQKKNFTCLINQAIYGPKNPYNFVLSNKEIVTTNPNTYKERIRTIMDYPHKIIYYGPSAADELRDVLNEAHPESKELKDIPERMISMVQRPTSGQSVYIAPYDAAQVYLFMVSVSDRNYDEKNEPIKELYNSYFSGGMNSIVFQEMREARSLAYSANAQMQTPSKTDEKYIYHAFIATQNDKMTDAIQAFLSIINDMPESEKAFDLAKESVLKQIRTERIKSRNLCDYILKMEDLNLAEDPRKEVYENVPNMTLKDITAYKNQFIRDNKYIYCVLGNEKKINISTLKAIGPVKRLTTSEIFGY